MAAMSDTGNHYSTLQPGRDLVVLVNVFTVAPGGQEAFADAQTGEYRRLRGKVEGSLAANLHRGGDGISLANLALFRSMPEFRAWVESDLMREHTQVIRHLIQRSEPGMYRVAHVTNRTGGDVAFVEETSRGGPLARLVRLRASDGARAGVLAGVIEAAPLLVREVPGIVSVTVLDGQPIGLRPPPSEGAPRGAVGDEKIQFQSPLVTAYIQVEDATAAEKLAAHALFVSRFTAAAEGVAEASSHLFEVAFVLNDDPDKPALPS
jgi:hypothetical protein